MKNDRKSASGPRPPVRLVTQQLYHALVLDTWPSPAAVVDFGIESERHYAALQHAIIHLDVTVEELDDAACDGPALTALIGAESPYHGLTFTTPWDDFVRRIPAPAAVPTGAKFAAGRLVATPGALGALSESDIEDALRRHLAGDWGDLSDADWAENEAALEYGDRLLSAYRARGGQKFWVLTEADRSVTTVLLPSEY
jgi:hypothetical protein